MFRTSFGKSLAAVGGALLLSQGLAAPASAFTLASPAIAEHFSSLGHIENAYWCRWGRCGYGYGYHRWGYGYRPWGYGYHPYYHPYGYGYYHPYGYYHRRYYGGNSGGANYPQ